MVEFGASLGVSTIYLAAAARDGGGSLITTECVSSKARMASQNLVEAGLHDVVEMRVGDALETLADSPGPVDVLFLDGRNDLYLPVLRVVEPRLASNALVMADLSAGDPDLVPYLEHVLDPAGGYYSVCVPLDDGVEFSCRVA